MSFGGGGAGFIPAGGSGGAPPSSGVLIDTAKALYSKLTEFFDFYKARSGPFVYLPQEYVHMWERTYTFFGPDWTAGTHFQLGTYTVAQGMALVVTDWVPFAARTRVGIGYPDKISDTAFVGPGLGAGGLMFRAVVRNNPVYDVSMWYDAVGGWPVGLPHAQDGTQLLNGAVRDLKKVRPQFAAVITENSQLIFDVWSPLGLAPLPNPDSVGVWACGYTLPMTELNARRAKW